MGENARRIGQFLELCIAEGRRERGARMELGLYADVDRLRDEGDVERDEVGERRGQDTLWGDGSGSGYAWDIREGRRRREQRGYKSTLCRSCATSMN